MYPKKIYHKIYNGFLYKSSVLRKRILKCNDFTIISNNCWGGMMYMTYGVPYNSPTVGAYFMSEDYIKLLENLETYFSKELTFISQKDSKWMNASNEVINYPIGKLGDIEIFFVHYQDKEEVFEKWERRKERVNWDNLIVKISEQNGFTKDHLERFEHLHYEKKIAFVGSNFTGDNVLRVANFSYDYERDIDINEEPRIGKNIRKLLS